MQFNPGEIWWMVWIYSLAECGNEGRGKNKDVKAKVTRLPRKKYCTARTSWSLTFVEWTQILYFVSEMVPKIIEDSDFKFREELKGDVIEKLTIDGGG